MNQLQNKKGFTLVEMLVYVAILLIVATASVTFLLSFDDFVAQYRIETALYRSGTTAMEQVVLSIRQAETFDTVGSIQHVATGTLSVTADGVTTVISRNNDELVLSIDGVDYGNLLYDTVEVTEFVVYGYDTTRGQFVRVKLSLTGTVNGVTKDLTLYGGSVVRGNI